MFKFLKWYWFKAQAAASSDILSQVRRLRPMVKDGRIYIDLEKLEEYCVKTFIIPSKDDDRPTIKIKQFPPVQANLNGIQTIPRTEGSQRSQSGSDPKI